ncbi:MAG: serine/threonine protein kinase [Firmicutes bacterium]|nr:serine/threonine protein kinase [Bacillota bacterium]
MSIKPGAILNHRYEVVRNLGEGATSTVYLVRDKREKGEMWALKQLTHSPEEDERESLLREVGFLSTLEHENLVRLVDYFVQYGWDFLVMERVMGPTLQEIIDESRHPLYESDVVEYALQVCRVLSYLHRQDPPVIYRDLKPGNIMITVQGHLKLIDLGIARHFNPMKPKDTTPLGTPGYCPPEQYGFGQTTQRSDIYSLGATLYHALTLQDPADFKFDFPPITQFNGNLSEPTIEIIHKCLMKSPEDRFENTDILYDNLMELKNLLAHQSNNTGFRMKMKIKNYHKKIRRIVTKFLTGKEID